MASKLTIGRRGLLLFFSALLIILSTCFVYNSYLRFTTLQGTQRQVLPSTGDSPTPVLPSTSVVLFGVSPVNHSKWSDSPVKHPKKPDVSDSIVEKETQCLLSRAFGKGLTLTALASPPGSGNTWVRNLLEESTGYYTGSIYNDRHLKAYFKGESMRDDTVVAIKSHGPYHPRKEDYERVVVLLRNPRDSLLSEFHRKHSEGGRNHVGRAPASAFEKGWKGYFAKDSATWLRFVKYWFIEFKVPVYVVHYEQLKSNLRETLRGVLDFLNIAIDERRLNCVVQNAEGNFHRPSDPNAIDPYTTAMITQLNNITQQGEEIIKKRLEQQQLQPAGIGSLTEWKTQPN